MSIKAKFIKNSNTLWQFSLPNNDRMGDVSFYTTSETDIKIKSLRTELNKLSTDLKSELGIESKKYQESIISINKALGDLPEILINDAKFINAVAERLKQLDENE